MRILYVLLLCVGTALAATHVNITIAQHPATNPADVTYVEGSAPAELRAGPATSSRVNIGEERFAKLRSAEEGGDGKGQVNSEQKQEQVSRFSSSSSSAQSAAQQVQPFVAQSSGFNGQQEQQQRFYGRLRQQNQQSQFRQANAQDKQNQEFERYIQNYHSGPTVETVFETSDHSPSARYSSSSTTSSSKSSTSARLVALDTKPLRQHTFERQVALPVSVVPTSLAASADEQSKSSPDAKIQISSTPVSAATSVPAQVSMHVSSSPAVVHAAPSVPSVTMSSSNSGATVISGGSDGGSFGGSYGGGGSSSSSHGVTFRVAGGSGGGGYNQPSYAKPEYEQPSYNYGNHGDGGGFVNEYPPAVEESSGGYDGYYGSQEHNYQSNAGYAPANPVYQRPVVTKTIQIAQPALKAKKFEVRHPAIQKEFYDIEERVVIKPAGTIVVELEHPVAKIPKGETVLPLGHPHPAIAAQYNLNSDADIETESSSAGSYNNGVQSSSNQVYLGAARKQPAPVVTTTHIGSTLTSTPSNNQNAKRDFVEASLRKQYGEEAQLVASTDNSHSKDHYIAVDNQGNQRQISNRNYLTQAFRRDEGNYQRPARVELKSNDESYRSTYAKNEEQSLKNNAQEVQSSINNGDDDYKGEYVTGNFYSSVNKDPKPARLQQAPTKSERITAEPQTHIIKHEHTIKLPPSQHNIYLAPSNFESRSVLVQEQRKPVAVPKQQHQQQQHPAHLEVETARVQEIKPFLNRQRDGVVVYAVPARRPAAAQQRYTENERRQPQYATSSQQRSYAQLRYNDNDNDSDSDADLDASVEYSAPYSHMRYESSRFTAGADAGYNRNMYDNSEQKTVSIHYNRGADSQSARLVSENTSASDTKESVQKVESNKVNGKPELHQLAHIQLQVPHGTQEADEPIRVMSEINPPKSDIRTSRLQQTATTKQVVHDQVEQINIEPSVVLRNNGAERDAEQRSSNIETKPDCVDDNNNKASARYESSQQSEFDSNKQYSDESRDRAQLKSQRLIDTSNSNANSKEGSATSSSVSSSSTNSQADIIDANAKDGSGHITSPGSRVIASNPAPNDASATSESFHKRRIVVNHPFQTVREVVEHEPITNYHQIQVQEPASRTSAYHKAPYFAPNGALRQFETRTVVGSRPATYHQSSLSSSSSTHGNLVYALPDAIPVHEDNGELEPSYSSQRRQRQQA